MKRLILAGLLLAAPAYAQSVTIDLGEGIYITGPSGPPSVQPAPNPGYGTPIWQCPTCAPSQGQPAWQQPAPVYVPQPAYNPYRR